MITAAPSPSTSAATTPVRDYISWSAISLYQSCPLRYYFRYIAGLPERTVSASLVFGAAIHRAVEHHFNELLAGNEPPNIEALVGEYDRHWSDVESATVQFGKGDDRDSLSELARRMFAAFQGSPLAQPGGHVIGVEETLRGPIVAGIPDVLGRVDLLVESADELVLTDLKTSRSRW
ncbi:MAG TPA: PD-(D/E)XK nuclease family protein, partial [Pirellulaceae bacterium]|nr:PD-(D/E)XK nuclease family protein [Pirellulaceae bacterium]